MRNIVRLCLTFILIFTFSEYSTGQYLQDTEVAPVPSPKDIIVKYGIASYYAKKFEGRKTYTDVRYNSQLLTAACNVLPMGTWVKVTNLKNDKSVVVEINDHLAKTNKRLIDLTYRAAKELGYVGMGITRVKVEVLGKLKSKKKGHKHIKHKKFSKTRYR